MQVLARLALFLPTKAIERSPGLWSRLAALWVTREEDERVRPALEAVAFVHELRPVLAHMGIDNARSLLVDGVTVFRDPANTPGDLPDLILALHEHTSVFGADCSEVRMSLETMEAGLHIGIEAKMNAEHAKDAPSATISILAQLSELNPSPHESASAYRERLDRFLANPRSVAAVQLQFNQFVSRLQGSLSHVFMDARLTVSTETIVAALPTHAIAPAPMAKRSSDASALLERAAPARNFSVSVDQQISALMTGAPAFALRLQKIETLEEKLVAAFAALPTAPQAGIPLGLVRALEDLNALIAEHNRFYPIERALPLDPATGSYTELGVAWYPRPQVTVESLSLRAKLRPPTTPRTHP